MNIKVGGELKLVGADLIFNSNNQSELNVIDGNLILNSSSSIYSTSEDINITVYNDFSRYFKLLLLKLIF